MSLIINPYAFGAGGGGAPDFDYTNLLWRVRGSDITGLSDGNALTGGGWLDTSGNSRHWAIGTAPLYQTNEINGHPAVQFRGNSTKDYLVGPDLSGLSLTEIDVYILIRADADPAGAGADAGLWRFNTGVDSTAAATYPFTDGVIYQTAFLNIPTVARVSVNPTPALTSWRLLRLIAKTGTNEYAMHLDGTSIVTATRNSLVFVATNWLGRGLSSSTNSNWMKAYVAEFFALSTKAGGAQYTTIKDYVNSYYALSVS